MMYGPVTPTTLLALTATTQNNVDLATHVIKQADIPMAYIAKRVAKKRFGVKTRNCFTVPYEDSK
jgi:hypothetical protein